MEPGFEQPSFRICALSHYIIDIEKKKKTIQKICNLLSSDTERTMWIYKQQMIKQLGQNINM